MHHLGAKNCEGNVFSTALFKCVGIDRHGYRICLETNNYIVSVTPPFPVLYQYRLGP